MPSIASLSVKIFLISEISFSFKKFITSDVWISERSAPLVKSPD
jgi:hypothetical protein